jgi:CheY-like chemotaxis protein
MMTESEAVRGASRVAPLLIVDDDESMRMLLAKILEREGWHVACAAGGAEAIDVLRGPLPGLVVLDLLMPGTTGWDVLEFMEGRPRLSAVPVVVLTAFGEEATAPRHRPVIHKPVEADLLVRVVRELSDEACAQAHARASARA